MKAARDRLAVALDVETVEAAVALATAVAPFAGVIKIGLELFVAHGPRVIDAVRGAIAAHDAGIFLDLKLHDIPETVGRSVARARDHGVRYLTIHASGGAAMLDAARSSAGDSLQLLGVTVLTSISAKDLEAQGISRTVDAHALDLARACDRAGIRGLVTSALEAAALRAALPNAFLVTPGIRPSGSSKGDQVRVATPAAAISAGADLLVVGRPIRDAADPAQAARMICEEIASALPQQ